MSKTPAQRFMELGEEPAEWIEAFNDVLEGTALGVHGGSLIAIDQDEIVIEMPIGDHARQPFGILHGGVSMLLAESAASMHACWGVDLSERVPVGTEISGSHISSTRDGTVVCRGRVVKRGRTLIRHHIELFHKESGRLLCDARVTNLYKGRF
jgi:uncharacterized protein (TIGR00369 family)